MRRASLGVLIAVGAMGCLHRSPEERILAAFADYGGQWLQAEKPPPEYLSFRDKVSAWVFRDLMSHGRFRVAPQGQALYCPGVPEKGNHGYDLGARVAGVYGDSAFAAISQTCARFAPKCPTSDPCFSMGGPLIVYETTYLLRLTNGRWKVVKPVSGGAIIPM
jgi:hypothetical protein